MKEIKDHIVEMIQELTNKKIYYVTLIVGYIVLLALVLYLVTPFVSNLNFSGTIRLIRIINYLIHKNLIFGIFFFLLFSLFYFIYLYRKHDSMPTSYTIKKICKNYIGIFIISIFIGFTFGMLIESSADIEQDIILIDLKYGISNSDFSFFDEYQESNPHSTIRLLETDTSITIEKGRGFRSNPYYKYLIIYFNIYQDKGNLKFNTADIGRIDVYRYDFNSSTGRFDEIIDTFYKKNDINKSVIVKENMISIYLNQDICNSDDSSYLIFVIRKEKNFIYDINKGLVIRGALQDKSYDIQYDTNYELTYYEPNYSTYNPYTNSITLNNKPYNDSKYDTSIELRNKNFDRVYLIYSIFISVFFGSLFSYFISQLFKK